ncbi:hypothetical protein GGH12_005922 [Coemansia sp. RSA 1822]|nr:hypothetical protein LPJ76_003199 [Coemansia sp. RSA 638]KAJ2120791.1 hypothetical protein IW147_004812 [Coemansia sp. RSA 720]KAJ2541043.1 hypothetical protein GGF49_003962 [Coemansia sp. RSA 1853]KAJ2558300.1 hypothetical protein GGH12_005922 [Coemansia sp. RSA 1822]
MDRSDRALVGKINDTFAYATQFLHYGMEIRPLVTWADSRAGQFVAEWQVTQDHIGAAGCIDEGLLGTVTDNATAMLIGSALSERGKSVSTSISVQAVAPVQPGAVVEIVCSLSSQQSKQPHATATFRDKADPQRIYAIGTHTKFFKAGLSETQPRL